MTNIILVIIVLLGLLTITVLIAFNQLSKEIRELEKEHEGFKTVVFDADKDTYNRGKRQQKDLGNLASDFEQFKLEYGAALDYSKINYLAVHKAEEEQKAEEAERAVMNEQRARVKAVSEKILDAFSKLLTNDKLTPDEASAAFETELQSLIAEYANELVGGIKDVIIPDSAYLHVGEISNGYLEDERGRIIG